MRRCHPVDQVRWANFLVQQEESNHGPQMMKGFAQPKHRSRPGAFNAGQSVMVFLTAMRGPPLPVHPAPTQFPRREVTLPSRAPMARILFQLGERKEPLSIQSWMHQSPRLQPLSCQRSRSRILYQMPLTRDMSQPHYSQICSIAYPDVVSYCINLEMH